MTPGTAGTSRHNAAFDERRLDSLEAEQARGTNSWRYNVVTVPLVRLLGLNAAALVVLLHHVLVGAAVPANAIVAFFVVVAAYTVASWAVLDLLWDRLRSRVDIQYPLLILDLVVCVVATYLTGAERSWLFFLIALRLADSGIGVRRTLVLAHLAPAMYVAMLWYVARFESRPIDFGVAALNGFTLYFTALYFTLIGRTAFAWRARMLAAVRVSRDLIAELEEKSERLAASMDRAEEASRAKTRLLATVSHELRTPLTAIIAQTELVMDEADPVRDAAVIEDLGQVVQAAHHLGAIIDDLLDVSHVEAGRLTLDVSRFEVVPLIAEVSKTIQPQVARENNVLEITHEGVSGSMRTDRARLRKILLILLGNAAKFTANGRVTFSAQRTGGSGGTDERVVFRVADTGVGIPEDLQATLFSAFTQGDSSTTRKFGGAGLGLVIAKRYAELISADLSYESEVGAGTTFVLAVPAELPATGADTAPALRVPPVIGDNLC